MRISHLSTLLLSLLLVFTLLSGCQAPAAPTVSPTITLQPSAAAPSPVPPVSPESTAASSSPATAVPSLEPYRDPALPVSERVQDLLGRMTLEEKIGQMTQIENKSLRPGDVTRYFLGSVLSGGDGAPEPNTPENWQQMVDGFQAEAQKTRLGIPIIYGVDAVHGLGGMKGATVFPHNVGLGATRDAALVGRIGRATAEEMVAVGITWNFGPVVAVPQDIRWGRTYEGFGEDTALVSELGSAYLAGLQRIDGKERLNDPLSVIATPKHFIGDGGTVWASSRAEGYILDQGDMQVDEPTLRQLYLPAYKAAVYAGARSVMVSFSSWKGVKMHADKYLLTDVLKKELGFSGFVVSDWAGINQIAANYDEAVVTSVNAGVDMVMVPYDPKMFIATLTRSVELGKVSIPRIDDAVKRILTVKMEQGLFERPYSNPAARGSIRSEAHLALAREAVQKSLVLLKNKGGTLPLKKDLPVLFVAGAAANDIGIQSGGWTLSWQGKPGNENAGTTILEGIKQTVSSSTRVEYEAVGNFDAAKDAAGAPLVADASIVVVGEKPYAEGKGDRADMSLASADAELIDRVKARSKRLVVVLISGRPLVVTGELPKWDALVAAWLPGTEGSGVADGLFGKTPFSGKLSYTWPRWSSQLPLNLNSGVREGCEGPLFPFGYGLTAEMESPPQLDCPVK